MQRSLNRCPRCDQPLEISRDMWGKYYLCGRCGFTAEDDDELYARNGTPGTEPAPELTRMAGYWLHETTSRR